jgi:hypothetical protein
MTEEKEDDLPLVRDLPRRSDPGSAGRGRIAKLSQAVGLGWAAFWWVFGPADGAARWYVGAAGVVLVAGARILLQTKGAAALDVSHLRLELATPAIRRGGRGQVTLTVLEPEKVRGRIDVTVSCTETYAYRVDSDRAGSSRRTASQVLWKWPLVVEPKPSQQIPFDLPPHLPFSWDGDLVKYIWTVTATERVERGLDPTIELGLRVLP